MSLKIGRQAYAEMFGPTTGDRVRLADTELWIEVEKDYTHYGEEVKFGGGKVIRDGMGQSQRVSKDCADTVITNALIVDHWGIVKADIGIKNGRIAAIGKAGNPDIQPAVTNFKEALRDLAKVRKLPEPRYTTVHEQGPEHSKTFTIEVRVGKEWCGQADARTKKIAAQRAARGVYERLLGDAGAVAAEDQESKMAADEQSKMAADERR